jgi:predicted MPP superfamily phosphohydrolase
MAKKISIIVLIFILLFFYATYICPNTITVKEETINEKIDSNYNNLTILQFSDILFGTTIKEGTFNKIIKRIKEYHPDIIVYSGDLIYSEYALKGQEKETLINGLKSLDASKKYAIVGDNDLKKYDVYKEIMESSGFIILNNTEDFIFNGSIKPISIVGITNKNYDKKILNNNEMKPEYRIVLTHQPDYADMIVNDNPDINLILSGHSLGGIIKIPYFKGLITKNDAHKYINHKYEINETKLYVSNGLGTEKYNFRFLNNPTINIYKIKTT